MEVHQQADFEFAEFQIRQQWGFENGVHLFDSFLFDNHRFLDQSVISLVSVMISPRSLRPLRLILLDPDF